LLAIWAKYTPIQEIRSMTGVVAARRAVAIPVFVLQTEIYSSFFALQRTWKS